MAYSGLLNEHRDKISGRKISPSLISLSPEVYKSRLREMKSNPYFGDAFSYPEGWSIFLPGQWEVLNMILFF